jgi:hypothetical protein
MRTLALWCACLLLALPCVAPAARAADSFDRCTRFLDALPGSVDVGEYVCLAHDVVQRPDLPEDIKKFLVTQIKARGTLDCLGHSLSYHWQLAIYSTEPDVTIRNCTILSTNNSTGVQLTGARAVVEDNVIEHFGGTALQVNGAGSVARRNTVRHIGGTGATGIVARYDVDVLGNLVHDVHATSGNAFGINVGANNGGLVAGNRVRDVSTAGTGISAGIATAGTTRNLIRDNRIVGDGSAASVGLNCSSTKARARDNVLMGVATGMPGCGDAGGNDITP